MQMASSLNCPCVKMYVAEGPIYIVPVITPPNFSSESISAWSN